MELDRKSQTVLPELSKKKWKFISRIAIPPLTKIAKLKARKIEIKNYTKRKLLFPLGNSRFDSVNTHLGETTKRATLPTDISHYNATITKPLNETIEPTLSLYAKLKDKLRGRIKVLHNLKKKIKEEPNVKGMISLKRFTEITPEIKKRIEENTNSLADQGSAGLLSFWEFRKENSEAFMSSISRLFFIR